MTPDRRSKLEAAGFAVGDASDFLGLTPAEAALVEYRLTLARELQKARRAAGMTQTALAQAIGSSQSRVAKAEAADPGVSTDLLLRALFGTGVRPDRVSPVQRGHDV